MVAPSVLESHREDLRFLRDQPPQIFADFCKLAWSFLSKGTNPKLYQTASQKLQVDAKQVQSGVEGLAYLFIESGRCEVTEEEFKQAAVGLGIPENLCSVAYSEYQSQKSILESVLPQVGVQHHQFKDLQWRFETKVSSRTSKNQLQPRVIMKLELEMGGESKSICLQSDISNVMHMNHLISQALQESSTHHSKRIQRAIS